MDLKFNIRQCHGVAPWEVSSTPIILMEMVPMPYLADLENRGLFWTLCFKNDSDKPAWIKEEDSKMIQVGILSGEAQGKDLQCNQAWGDLAARCGRQPQGTACMKYSSNLMRTKLEPTGRSYWFGGQAFPNPIQPRNGCSVEQKVWTRSSRSGGWRGICQGPCGREGSPAWARSLPGLFQRSPSFFLLLAILLL